jgi:hypothetical protein
MKSKLVTLFMVALTGLVFLAVGALTAADVPEEVSIENEGYKSDKKGPVPLSHKKHVDEYGVACTECHHDYQDGKNVWKEGDPVKKCAECHPMETKEAKSAGVDKLKNAYHKNCKNCHKEKGKGPFKKCTECHGE